MIVTLRRVVGWISVAARDLGERLLPWKVYDVNYVEDLPDKLAPRTVYVVCEGDYQLNASMACPQKRCEVVLNMNLAPDDDPQWTMHNNSKGRPTLNPSVWRTEDCGCHFVLRHGRIKWC